ncbi:MAG: hypothetical protein A3J93_00175 [Candidatus Magasanikbacteria bacterium RIFOXYC2_FULL_42_28]|uniref:DUF2231 domain-containing protein n=1 Tax=Candidatus Magasanikbacteria bacterium RIFOXYC2_FULL_42_28 TaxID=1798704 RepID=A0A1F6NW24_9BACT|nr:MAG: hypothetical protein A3J93_00175 [Candidatus Magasanikbacteria bacterium RIFOXYC2_FULL_42_28]
MGPLHAAIVHIPIGLLVVYSLIEFGLVFFPSYREKLNAGKYLMLVIGVLGALLAFSSGDSLEETRRFNRALVELHATFAGATIWVYAILAGAFSIQFLEKLPKVVALAQSNFFVQKILKILSPIVGIITKQPILVLLSILGAILLSFTGALGGAIAHGPDADIITSFVYSLFFNNS